MPRQPDLLTQADDPNFTRLAHQACRFALDRFSEGDALGAQEWLELSLLWLKLMNKKGRPNAPR